MAELVTLNTANFAGFVLTQAIKEGELVQQVETGFFITCFHRCVGGEHKTLLHFFHRTILTIDMKGSGQRVRFVHVPNVRVNSEII